MITEEPKLRLLVYKSIKILRKNYGCPGDDGISYKQIKGNIEFHVDSILTKIRRINNGIIDTTCPRAVMVMDAHKKHRVIYVYTIYDRVVQQVLRLLIEAYLKPKIARCVFSFKKGMGSVKEINLQLLPGFANSLVLRTDIEKYYESIDKVILFRMLLSEGVPENLIECLRISLNHCQSGIPAGNCLSPMISDFYLTPVDNHFNNSVYVRFSDDMFFSLKENLNSDIIINMLTILVGTLKLKLNVSKQCVLPSNMITTA